MFAFTLSWPKKETTAVPFTSKKREKSSKGRLIAEGRCTVTSSEKDKIRQQMQVGREQVLEMCGPNPKMSI